MMKSFLIVGALLTGATGFSGDIDGRWMQKCATPGSFSAQESKSAGAFGPDAYIIEGNKIYREFTFINAWTDGGCSENGIYYSYRLTGSIDLSGFNEAKKAYPVKILFNRIDFTKITQLGADWMNDKGDGCQNEDGSKIKAGQPLGCDLKTEHQDPKIRFIKPIEVNGEIKSIQICSATEAGEPACEPRSYLLCESEEACDNGVKKSN